MASFIHCPC
jgi:hypothetical protein